jgi:hypothetical protein
MLSREKLVLRHVDWKVLRHVDWKGVCWEQRNIGRAIDL